MAQPSEDTPSPVKKGCTVSWSMILFLTVLVGVPVAIVTPKFGAISPVAQMATARRNAETIITLSKSRPLNSGESPMEWIERLKRDNGMVLSLDEAHLRRAVSLLRIKDGKLQLHEPLPKDKR